MRTPAGRRVPQRERRAPLSTITCRPPRARRAGRAKVQRAAVLGERESTALVGPRRGARARSTAGERRRTNRSDRRPCARRRRSRQRTRARASQGAAVASHDAARERRGGRKEASRASSRRRAQRRAKAKRKHDPRRNAQPWSARERDVPGVTRAGRCRLGAACGAGGQSERRSRVMSSSSARASRRHSVASCFSRHRRTYQRVQ